MSTDTQQRHSTTNPAKVDFWKSLLRIDASVAVTLASKDLQVERILSLVPGMMIQFDKGCDAPLLVEVDNQKIAEGEVVKVGDKFGLRITEILTSDERWIPLVKDKTTPKTDVH
ncbi:FliM/FliN family flagellar motor switch protein [Pirellulaceae bacterium SH467]|jgi:flagellar motor switch protein FliN/FliY